MTAVGAAERRARVIAWLLEDALPLWRGAGVDAEGFGVWEALGHDGRPETDLPKRLRVQARQAFAFATAARELGTDDLPLAERLFEATLAKGVDARTGLIAAMFDGAGRVLDAPHELYDIAFLMLAAASLRHAGADVDGAPLDGHLDRLKAERGWREAAAEAGPRRQNPHMHLFEAALAWVEAGEAGYLPIVEECLALMKEVFLQADGTILEYFTEDWRPVSSGQRIEPGHGAEWIYLIDRYERLTGQDAGVDLETMFARVLASRDSAGFLPDSTQPPAGTRRLWPQTELLKAAVVMAARGAGSPDLAHGALDAFFADYLSTPAPGGWFDRFETGGALISEVMPASSFYHVLVAFLTYRDLTES